MMEIDIFVEPSKTTADTKDCKVRDYYQGLFNSVTSLDDDLSIYGETNLYVLSDEFGVARGSDLTEDVINTNQSALSFSAMVNDAQEDLLEAASTSDVMIILLSTDVFQKTVGSIWNELTTVAVPGSIWCLAAANSALSDLNFRKLEEKKCTVVTYQRVGVARLGTETQSSLVEAVREKTRN